MRLAWITFETHPPLLSFLEHRPETADRCVHRRFAEPYEAPKELLQDILYDPIRMSYYHDYMEAILIAISEGIDVIGCLAWSLYDNYEVFTFVPASRGNS